MTNTYTKGATGDEWIFPGSVTISGTLTPNTVTETYTATAAGTPITIDAGTTDHTGASLIEINLDVNSSNSKVINMDIDVGTALSSGEKVYGVYVDQLGLAGDDAASEMTGVLVRSATNATGGINSGVQLTGAFDTGVDVASANTTGVLISGINANGISLTGANTTAALNISGDQAKAIIFTATESAVAGLHIATPTTKTTSTGILMDGAGTVTTGIDISPTACTAGLSIGAGVTTAILALTPIVVSVTDAADVSANATGVKTSIARTTTYSNSIAGIRSTATVTTAGAIGNAYGGRFEFASTLLPSGQGHTAALYAQVTLATADNDATSVISLVKVSDTGIGLVTPFINIMDVGLGKTDTVMEFGTGGALGTAASANTTVAFSTGAVIAAGDLAQGLRVKINGAIYFIPVVAVAVWDAS